MDETAPFQIRDFPVALRKEIVAEAEAAKVSVPEFMTGVCMVSRAAGWPRVIEAAGRLNGLTTGKPLDPVALAPLVPSMPRWLRAALWRRVAAQLGVEAPANVRKNLLSDGTRGAFAANPPSDEPNGA